MYSFPIIQFLYEPTRYLSSMNHQRIVVKLGTSTLTKGTAHLNRQRMLEIVQEIAILHQHGHEMVLVSSGAQAAGRERLQFPDLGRSLPAKQMLSAVGQGHLMHIYSELFDIFEIIVAQVLLTRDDLSNRTRYLNARDTLRTLIDSNIIPIVNENDTVATNEIRVGDNDNLSAMVASVLETDLLIILTDQPGLFTADPRQDKNAKLIKKVTSIDDSTYALAGGVGSSMGTGGMATKIEAAHLANRSGVQVIVASGKESNIITRITNDEQVGTRFIPTVDSIESRKRWLITERTQGKINIDEGASQKLLTSGASLLPVGIISVEGDFERGAALSIHAPDGTIIAHGLSNYGSKELNLICGKNSSKINKILGYTYGDYVIHRNNMVLLT